MIFGIGIDITTINRFEKWITDDNLCRKYYSEEEIDYIFSKGRGAVQSLAAGFAAKEAFGKALGTGLSGLKLKDIIVVREKSGKPFLNLRGKALEKLSLCGSKPIVHLSLSHESQWAVAQVVIEVDNG